jgi:hypothetical protein
MQAEILKKFHLSVLNIVAMQTDVFPVSLIG